MFVQTFLARFRQSYFLSQSEYFVWAIALHCGNFLPFPKCSHFSNISCFVKPFFAYNKSNVFVETFFASFLHFLFLIESK